MSISPSKRVSTNLDSMEQWDLEYIQEHLTRHIYGGTHKPPVAECLRMAIRYYARQLRPRGVANEG